MMFARIVVENRKEAEQIRLGLEIPEVRAFVKVMGVLSKLPSQQAKRRVLNFVWHSFAEEEATKT